MSGPVEFGFCFETELLAGDDEFPRPITKRFRTNRRNKEFLSDVHMDQSKPQVQKLRHSVFYIIQFHQKKLMWCNVN